MMLEDSVPLAIWLVASWFIVSTPIITAMVCLAIVSHLWSAVGSLNLTFLVFFLGFFFPMWQAVWTFRAKRKRKALDRVAKVVRSGTNASRMDGSGEGTASVSSSSVAEAVGVNPSRPVGRGPRPHPMSPFGAAAASASSESLSTTT